jgi:hypothetical protein
VGEAKGKGWTAVDDCPGNGFGFVEENGFGFAAGFGTELIVSGENGFATAGNGFVVCPALGNGFVLEFVVG